MILFNPSLEGGDMRVHAFLKSISLNVNIIAPLEFELAYFETSLLLFNYYKMVEYPDEEEWSNNSTNTTGENCYFTPIYDNDMLISILIEGGTSATIRQVQILFKASFIWLKKNAFSANGKILGWENGLQYFGMW